MVADTRKMVGLELFLARDITEYLFPLPTFCRIITSPGHIGSQDISTTAEKVKTPP
jgi:hypothetical protein